MLNKTAWPTTVVKARSMPAGGSPIPDPQDQVISQVFDEAVTSCTPVAPGRAQYFGQVTGVYSGDQPDDSCGWDRRWRNSGSGLLLCGRFSSE
ncbi:hypothetical protein [Actinomadura harenae]|uniref:Uncharacterized protein n=1 Tax=Actinomadura harenae TaxID=2483351 RepID=A0A3M2LN49_9ACTN|nr:hypothetical protein [Actinomadura harenae]RMI37515.1 hypothetical protein EBO15_35735 [Actinomadura harenae]